MSVDPREHCELTRERLLTASPDELSQLRDRDPHLAGDTPCLQCNALLDALLERNADLDRALETFASRPRTPHASEDPLPEPAANRWSWTMTLTSLTLAAAAVATLTVGFQQASIPGATDGGGATKTCILDTDMEERALSGRLGDDDVACLESSGGAKANRLLMVHWFAGKDLDAWRQRAQVELNREIASNDLDVDILYKVALYDSKAADHASAWELSRLATGRCGRGPDEVVEKRSFNLLKIRALAAMEQWGGSEVATEKAKLADATAEYEAAKSAKDVREE